MDDGKPQKLAPEEAGAFVAQWAEHNPVSAEELAELLNIDRSQVESLVRQSKGRLSMEKWLSQGKSTSAKNKNRAIPLFVIGICTFAFGVFAAKLLFSSKGDVSSPPATVTKKVSFDSPPGSATTEPPDLSKFIARPASPSGNDQDSVESKGDAVVHEGYSVGTGIAILTMGGSRAADGQAPGMAGRADSSAIVPIPSLRTGGKKVFDETSRLNSMNVSIPADIVIELKTPEALFVVKGVQTHDPSLAENLDLEEYSRPLDALMQCALEDGEFPSQSPKLHLMNAVITIKMGLASVSKSFRWEKNGNDRLRTMFSNPVDPSFVALIKPIMDQIKYAGLKLFVGGPQPSITPSK